VLSPESLTEWPTALPDIAYQEVGRNTDLAGGRHERPLVVILVSPQFSVISDQSEEHLTRPCLTDD
jgi:hypothetical protein